MKNKQYKNTAFGVMTYNKQELIDLVACIDYVDLTSSTGLLPNHPIYFTVENKDKIIEGSAGIDEADNQVLYKDGKLINKQYSDDMLYGQINEMLTKAFELKKDSVIYLLEGSFTGKKLKVDNRVPVTDEFGDIVK